VQFRDFDLEKSGETHLSIGCDPVVVPFISLKSPCMCVVSGYRKGVRHR
jgi:hypothetical protein